MPIFYKYKYTFVYLKKAQPSYSGTRQILKWYTLKDWFQ